MITTNVLLLRTRAGGEEDGWKMGVGRERRGAADKDAAHKDGRNIQGHGG